MNSIYLLLGSNQGERSQWLRLALHAISDFSEVTAQSALYETAAWGLEDQPDFLNMAIRIMTPLPATEVLKNIQRIEADLGRQRAIKWGQRTLDIDILFVNNEIIDTDTLQVPHPFLHERRFVLQPLNEIAPAYIHPVFKKTVSDLLKECGDKLAAQKLDLVI